MSADFRNGRREGLREALAILAVEEDKWTERMSRTSRAKTLQVQAVRRKAFEVAQTRIRTALNRIEKQDEARGDDISSAMKRALGRLGL